MKINFGMYMNAKRGYTGSGKLSKYAVVNIEQLLRLRDAGGTNNLNIEVLLARDELQHVRPIEDGFDTEFETHWLGARSIDPNAVAGQVLTGQTGTAMFPPKSKLLTNEALEHFVTLLRARSAEAANVLLFWGHCDGPRGLLFSLTNAYDRTHKPGAEYGRDILSPEEVSAALASSGSGLKKLELVCVDACQSACLEFASMFSEHAQYMVSSQTPVPGSGWNYESWPAILNSLANDDWSGAAKGIASDFGQSNQPKTTISAIDLSKIADVLVLLRAVTAEFLIDDEARASLVAARLSVATPDNNLSGLVDIVALFDATHKLLADGKLKNDCSTLVNATKAAVLSSHASKDLNQFSLNGCSIFFPTAQSSYGPPWDDITKRIYFENNRQLALFKKTGWHNLLKITGF